MASAARRTAQAPMKVFEKTRSQARFAAVVTETTQAEIMETAMNEYIERHAEEFALGLKHAHEALLGGTIETLAYVLDADPEVIRRIAGDVDPDHFKPRRAERPHAIPAAE
jgi:hypothetical protein